MHRVVRSSVLKNIIGKQQKMKPTKVIGRMFAQQESLPKLPVPALDATLQKYLRTVRPLVSDEDFEQTKKYVEEFRKDSGPKLQKFLEERATKEVNWLSDWWASVAYLEFRNPVVIHVSPGIVLPKQNYTDTAGQLRYAAKLVAGVLDYKIMVDEQTLEVEYMGKNPLCMTQFYKILSACRTPGLKKDMWECFPPDEPNPPTHVTVIHNNTFFSLEAYGKNHKPLSVDQIYNQLQKVVEMSKNSSTPVGILTSENRNTWAKAYNHLVKDKTNQASIQNIKRSIFVLCLDELLPGDMSDERSVAAKMMLHGGGSQLNTGNRWFDKTIQFVVGRNGICGLSYEHTTAEGPPVVSLMDHVAEFCKTEHDEGLPAENVKPVEKLEFNLDNKSLEAIDQAKKDLDKQVKDLDLTVAKFTDYGKNFPKSVKLSPDSYIQTAFQLAFYRLYNEPCATYETASLRKYQHGRTDTIRSCSIESLAFCKGMCDTNVSQEQKRELLKKAVNSHKNYVNEAINGQGIDRHLLGLKLAAIKNGMNVPDLHMDQTYSTSCHFKLSTSQVPSKEEAVLVFGPVVPNGYGLCYNPQESQIIFGVSAFNCSPETESNKMANSVRQSLIDMKNLMAGSVQAKL
ncbi:carnitine O-acetyltransferase [Mytilus galloprovincialis]|uniref:Carnitine O-acetyltransferase n=1 Tax=Mytilus galloprovincialis TaxID=29158 RepID=A0A8B6DJD2_MYTGA|nr:carnitine O-acetyltransferase [Mytilus galloprovincialis]